MDIAKSETLKNFTILHRASDLRLVCCFLQFKKLMKQSIAIFDSSIDMFVVL